MAKRKPPEGGLTVPELKAHAAKRKGRALTKEHRRKISEGLMRHHARKAGMTLKQAKAKKAKAANARDSKTAKKLGTSAKHVKAMRRHIKPVRAPRR